MPLRASASNYMGTVTLSSSDLTAAATKATTMGANYGSTVTSNLGYPILIAGGVLIIGLLFCIWYKFTHFGKRSGGGMHFSDNYSGLSDERRAEWNRLDDYGMPKR